VTLKRKREEYAQIVQNYFGNFSLDAVTEIANKPNGVVQLSEFEKKNLKQIKIDVLRT